MNFCQAASEQKPQQVSKTTGKTPQKSTRQQQDNKNKSSLPKTDLKTKPKKKITFAKHIREQICKGIGKVRGKTQSGNKTTKTKVRPRKYRTKTEPNKRSTFATQQRWPASPPSAGTKSDVGGLGEVFWWVSAWRCLIAQLSKSVPGSKGPHKNKNLGKGQNAGVKKKLAPALEARPLALTRARGWWDHR